MGHLGCISTEEIKVDITTSGIGFVIIGVSGVTRRKVGLIALKIEIIVFAFFGVIGSVFKIYRQQIFYVTSDVLGFGQTPFSFQILVDEHFRVDRVVIIGSFTRGVVDFHYRYTVGAMFDDMDGHELSKHVLLDYFVLVYISAESPVVVHIGMDEVTGSAERQCYLNVVRGIRGTNFFEVLFHPGRIAGGSHQ